MGLRSRAHTEGPISVGWLIKLKMALMSRKRVYAGKRVVTRKKAKIAPRLRAFARPTGALSELGVYDFSVNPEASTTAYVGVVNVIPEGDGKSNRHGNRVVTKSIELRTYVYPGASQTTHQVYTCLLVYDKQCNGALPAATDVWTSASSLAFKNIDNGHRFVILKKIEGIMAPVADDVAPKEDHTYLKVNLPTYFDASAGSITDITTGSILLFVLGDTALSAGTHPQVRFCCRLRFQS